MKTAQKTYRCSLHLPHPESIAQCQHRSHLSAGRRLAVPVDGLDVPAEVGEVGDDEPLPHGPRDQVDVARHQTGKWEMNCLARHAEVGVTRERFK